MSPDEPLSILLVTRYCPAAHEDADECEGKQLMSDGRESATTDENGADSIDEIVHGVDVCGEVRPPGHGASGREETAEQHDAYHEEPHHEDGLLHGVTIVADDKSERREEQGKKHCQHIYPEQGAGTGDAIDSPCKNKTHGNYEEGNEPVRD